MKIRMRAAGALPAGLALSEDESTGYGGDTVEPGSGSHQEFPAGDHSRELFLAQVAAAFDLTAPVDPPPAPCAVESQP